MRHFIENIVCPVAAIALVISAVSMVVPSFVQTIQAAQTPSTPRITYAELGVDFTSININWSDLSGGDSYTLYRNGESYRQGLVDPWYVDHDVIGLSTYYYSVSACDNDTGCSEPSTQMNFIIVPSFDGSTNTPVVEMDAPVSEPKQECTCQDEDK